MVLKMISQNTVDSPMLSEQQLKDHVFPPGSLPRQTSIYSLTMNEFQNSMNESGKNFGSMNMEEFLNSLWTSEEIQAQTQDHNHSTCSAMAMDQTNFTATAAQPTHYHQGNISAASFALPSPLSRKTVEEVWDEIQRSQQDHQKNASSNLQNPAQRQLTYGEMTLEDFLIKAGVIRDPRLPPLPRQSFAALYSLNRNSTIAIDDMSFIAPRSQMQFGGNGGDHVQIHDSGTMNGDGGGLAVEVAPPLMTAVSVTDSANQADGESRNEVDIGAGVMRGGRKRIINGPMEVVIERRQRRMIKNRESAARSRARKQAYTVELEAEMNKLRAENARLKHVVAELKQWEEMKDKLSKRRAQNVGNVRKLSRSSSYP